MMLAVRGLSLRKFSLFGRSKLDPDEQIRIMSALGAVRLPSCNSVPIRELSYGEQRQIAIAVSLVTWPRLLLLHEPSVTFGGGIAIVPLEDDCFLHSV